MLKFNDFINENKQSKIKNIDEILDKILEQGIDSLTDEEKDILNNKENKDSSNELKKDIGKFVKIIPLEGMSIKRASSEEFQSLKMITRNSQNLSL